MNIAKIDLNLLQTFDAIYAEASVSRAADRLGVSQPTVSHALARLRTLYGDPLFVRRASGVTPTAKADRLADAVRQALRILDVAIHEADRYDPAASERTFRLHMTDIGEAIFLPRLMAALARRAPRVRVEARQLDDGDILPALESARIDLALGYIPALASVDKTLLLSERYVVVMRRDHPLAPRDGARAGIAAPRESRAAVDSALHGAAAHPRRNRSRRGDAVAALRRVRANG